VTAPEVDFDHHSPELVETWRERYRDLRQHCPVAYSPHYGGFYVVSAYEDMVRVWLDTETYSSAFVGDPPTGTTIPPSPVELGILNMDPPEHSKYRKVFMPTFSAAGVEAMRPRIREIVDATIDRFIETGECDLIRDFAHVFLTVATLELMGMPIDRSYPYMRVFFASAEPGHWSDMTDLGGDFDPMAVMNFVLDDIRGLVRRRAARPGTPLYEWQQAVIDGAPIEEEQLVRHVFVFLAGGTENMTATIGNIFRHLQLNPDHRRWLQQDPALLPVAIEELLRFYPGATTNMRQVVRPTTLRGVDLKPGDRVMVLFASGNESNPNIACPEQFILDRTPNSHVTFGLGRHRCIGARLAQAQLEIIFRQFLTRLPDLEIDTGAIVRPPSIPQADTWVAMPARFTPGPRSGLPPLEIPPYPASHEGGTGV
jgi:cytochrome P450